MQFQSLSPNLNIMIKAAQKASKILIRDFGEVQQLQNSMKGVDNFVASSKKKAEEIIINELITAKNKYGYSTPTSVQKGQDIAHNFIINAVDGEANFKRSIPHFAISIALQEQNKLVAAVIYNPVNDFLYYAENGGGAFFSEARTSRRLRVGGKKELKNSIIVVSNNFEKSENDIKPPLVQKMLHNIGIETRILGSTSMDLAYLADNKIDGFIGFNENFHPSAAGMLIVKEAGGFIKSFDEKGKEAEGLFYTDCVIAGNLEIQKELSDFVFDK